MPQLIVPDNPRATIADPDRYEPRAGDTMLDFARHYGTSFLPARVYRPLDKTKGGSCGPSRRARFMLTAAPFHVARSVDEFAYVMYDYDEGQRMAGWLELFVHSRAGAATVDRRFSDGTSGLGLDAGDAGGAAAVLCADQSIFR
ncbi:hypothetical protein J6360_23545 [Burkholderia pseudomallei]|nr:hypothetical protein [Burkholderia pseudomallei]MBO7805725.1 hypothetical protein [Burkholderia pseudomallei]